MKTCKICGVPFNPLNSRQPCCSQACSKENSRLKSMEYNRQRTERRKAARPKSRACEACGKEFELTNVNQRYCSDECRKVGLAAAQERRQAKLKGIRIASGSKETLDEKMARYKKSGLSYGYVVAYDHPEWTEVTTTL